MKRSHSHLKGASLPVALFGWVALAVLTYAQPAPPRAEGGESAQVQEIPPPPPVFAPGASATNSGTGPRGLLRSLTRLVDPSPGPDQEAAAVAQSVPASAPTADTGEEGLEPELTPAERAKQKIDDMASQGAKLADGVWVEPPESIFLQQDGLQNLLRHEPRWIWKNRQDLGRPDPMLIYWVAESLIFELRDEEARALESQGKLEEAKAVYEGMLLSISDPANRTKIEERIAQIEQTIADQEDAERELREAAKRAEELRQQQEMEARRRAEAPSQIIIVDPVLPQFIAVETRGVIYEPDFPERSVVSIGDMTPVRVGERVKGFEGVTVKEVRPQLVVYSVSNLMEGEAHRVRDFEIKVDGNLLGALALDDF